MMHYFSVKSDFVFLGQNSALRWDEIADLEHVIKQFNKDFNWTDAPVECMTHFHARLQEFMKEYIIERELVGKVEHWIIRYEFQVGSFTITC